ncbi:LysE family transporter [Polaribacter sp.]|nr:LysE family transporter [Polaribacter sp.]
MDFLIYILLGFGVSVLGSIMPSMLNITVIKFSLNSGRKSAFYLILGISTIIAIQANIGAYFSGILMKNSDYVTTLQKIGTVILALISINFFRIYLKTSKKKRKERVQSKAAYWHGFFLSALNVFALPFFFSMVSLLIAFRLFEYTLLNGVYFSIGSVLGTIALLTLYSFVARRIEEKIAFLANKMDLVLGCLTAIIAIGNTAYLFYKQ